jgi:hypothetical protein
MKKSLSKNVAEEEMQSKEFSPSVKGMMLTENGQNRSGKSTLDK